MIYKSCNLFKTLTRVGNGRTFYRALALGLSSELPTLCGQLARRSTAKLCHNQVHMTCGSHPLFILLLKQSLKKIKKLTHRKKKIMWRVSNITFYIYGPSLHERDGQYSLITTNIPRGRGGITLHPFGEY